MKKIVKTGDRIVIELERGEAAFLRSLPAELARSHKPARYAADSKTDTELRTLLDAELRDRRAARFEAFVKLLGSASAHKIELDDRQAGDWLALLTDLRLALAEILGIEDDDWGKDLDPRKPTSREVALYLYLTSLQSALLANGFDIKM